MTFPDKNNRPAGSGKKLRHRRGHTGAGAIHQRFHLDTARERGLFRRSHSGGAYDRRFQLFLRTFLFLLFPGRAALALSVLAAAMSPRRFRRSFPAPAETLRRHPDEIVSERNAAQTRRERADIGRRLPPNPASDL